MFFSIQFNKRFIPNFENYNLTRYEYRKLFREKVDKRDLWEGITQEYLRKLREQERRKWKKEESELAGFFMEIGNKREIGKRGREGMTFFF